MNHRFLLAPVIACMVMATSAHAAPQINGHQLSVGAAEVQQYLDESFPRTHKALGGLLALDVSHPQLTLPAGNRLALGFDLGMSAAGSSRLPVGNVRISSGLRYDVQTRGFHLDQPTVDDFQPAIAGAELDSGTRGLLNSWLADYARHEPVYRIDPAIANLLGALQVESVGIENGRIAVRFNQDLDTLMPLGMPGP